MASGFHHAYKKRTRMEMENTGNSPSSTLDFQTKLDGRIALSPRLDQEKELLKDPGLYKFIWVKDGRLELDIDHARTSLNPGDALPLSPYQHVSFPEVEGEYSSLVFNSNFYCIFGHDDEVSCNGFLFNGSSDIMRLHLDDREFSSLKALSEGLAREYAVCDDLQEEMLRIQLKRFIIFFTRIARERHDIGGEKARGFETVRKYYALVNAHFREKKQVRDYASMLARSPKTLSHLFAAFGLPSPLQVIHERTEAEAKRLLLHSGKSVKEIADILGFEDSPSLSRFFKNRTGESLSDYKKRMDGKN